VVPASLPPAVFALAGVFLGLEAVVFYYFKENVRSDTKERLVLLLAKESNKKLMKKIELGQAPDIVVRDFAVEISSIGEPKRMFQTLLRRIPITSLFLLGSGLLAWSEEILGSASPFLPIIEPGVYVMLAVGIAIAVWCIFAIARLGMELS
jgi:hypothetical protein